MAYNKVVLGEDDVLIDLTQDTVTEEDVLKGKIFHKPDGEVAEGTYEPPVTPGPGPGTDVKPSKLIELSVTSNGVYLPTDPYKITYGDFVTFKQDLSGVDFTKFENLPYFQLFGAYSICVDAEVGWGLFVIYDNTGAVSSLIAATPGSAFEYRVSAARWYNLDGSNVDFTFYPVMFILPKKVSSYNVTIENVRMLFSDSDCIPQNTTLYFKDSVDYDIAYKSRWANMYYTVKDFKYYSLQTMDSSAGLFGVQFSYIDDASDTWESSYIFDYAYLYENPYQAYGPYVVFNYDGEGWYSAIHFQNSDGYYVSEFSKCETPSEEVVFNFHVPPLGEDYTWGGNSGCTQNFLSAIFGYKADGYNKVTVNTPSVTCGKFTIPTLNEGSAPGYDDITYHVYNQRCIPRFIELDVLQYVIFEQNRYTFKCTDSEFDIVKVFLNYNAPEAIYEYYDTSGSIVARLEYYLQNKEFITAEGTVLRNYSELSQYSFKYDPNVLKEYYRVTENREVKDSYITLIGGSMFRTVTDAAINIELPVPDNTIVFADEYDWTYSAYTKTLEWYTKSITLARPNGLIPSNIAKGVTIAGVEGTLPKYESKIFYVEDLDFRHTLSDGNRWSLKNVPDGVRPSDIYIKKPDTLISKNIANGVNIAGITGSLSAPSGTITITKNGSHNVKNFETAKVQVELPTENLIITKNGLYDVLNYASVHVAVPEGVVDDILSRAVSDSLVSLNSENLAGVTNICSYAFRGRKTLLTIELPESLVSIGSYAFYDCDNVTTLTLPTSLTNIGSYAFYQCSKIEEVAITNANINQYAFSKCTNLKYVTLLPRLDSSSISVISGYAFKGSKLEWIDLTNYKTEEFPKLSSKDAFEDCGEFEIHIPAGRRSELLNQTLYGDWYQYSERFVEVEV